MSSAAARAGELRAVVTELEGGNGEDGEVAKLTAVVLELTARSGTSYCDGEVAGDLDGQTWEKCSGTTR